MERVSEVIWLSLFLWKFTRITIRRNLEWLAIRLNKKSNWRHWLHLVGLSHCDSNYDLCFVLKLLSERYKWHDSTKPWETESACHKLLHGHAVVRFWKQTSCSVEVANDLATDLLVESVLVSHNTLVSGDDDAAELTGRQDSVHEILELSDSQIETRWNHTTLVKTTVKFNHNLSGACVIDNGKLIDVTLLLHQTQELHKSLRDRAQDNLVAGLAKMKKGLSPRHALYRSRLIFAGRKHPEPIKQFIHVFKRRVQ